MSIIPVKKYFEARKEGCSFFDNYNYISRERSTLLSWYLIFINNTWIIQKLSGWIMSNERRDLADIKPEDCSFLNLEDALKAFWKFKRSRSEMLCKKMGFFKFHKIPRKTPKFTSFFNQVAGVKAFNFRKIWLHHRCFPVNFAKLLATFILWNICKRLLLELCESSCIMLGWFKNGNG